MQVQQNVPRVGAKGGTELCQARLNDGRVGTTTGDIDRMLEILAPVWTEAEQKFAGKSAS